MLVEILVSTSKVYFEWCSPKKKAWTKKARGVNMRLPISQHSTLKNSFHEQSKELPPSITSTSHSFPFLPLDSIDGFASCGESASLCSVKRRHHTQRRIRHVQDTSRSGRPNVGRRRRRNQRLQTRRHCGRLSKRTPGTNNIKSILTWMMASLRRAIFHGVLLWPIL